MSTNKFLGLVNGVKTWFTAIAVSTGAPDANKIPMTDSAGRFDISLMPSGIGAATQTALATEALVAGDFVNIVNNAGTPNVRKADSSNNRPAHGFVLAAVANAANATVYLGGMNNARSGLTPGALYFLSTSGSVSTTAPTTVGHIIQEIGVASNATTIQYDFDAPVVIA
jgi:hypothetical protein